MTKLPVFMVVILSALLIAQHAHAAKKNPKNQNYRLCPAEADPQGRPSRAGVADGFIQLEADDGAMQEAGASTFTGNVQVVRDDQAIRADKLVYDNSTETVDVYGNAQIWKGPLYWEGEHGHVDMAQDRGRLENGRYRLLGMNGRGHAKLIQTELGKKLSKLENVDYTTCPGDEPDWKLEAHKITLDHHDEWGAARDVTLRWHGVPIFYTPYMSFPLSDKRKSGFLSPSVGSTDASGAEIRTPYYWNIAPEMDATFIPRVLSERGVMLGGEFRYLAPTFNSTVRGEFLPADGNEDEDHRYLFRLQHVQSFGAHTYFNVDFNDVSDKRYTEDFGNNLGSSSTRFLERRALLSHARGWFSGSALADAYELVDPSLTGAQKPYDRLPQISMNLIPASGYNTLNYGVLTQATYFTREDSVTGGRLHVEPFVSYPFHNAGSFITPRIALEQTNYTLDDIELALNPLINNDNPARTTPVASVDAGVFFERPVTWNQRGFISTLEPRAFYLYRPKTGQDDIPVFDSGEYDVSLAQLFYTNEFAGYDRVSDNHSISLALTSRLIDSQSGNEWLRASLGERFNLADRDITLPGRTPQRDALGEIIAEVNARVTEHWSVGGALQWDPSDDATDKSAVRLRYRAEKNRVFNFDYRFRDAVTDVEQTDISFHWPLGKHWGMVGRWNYSLPEGRTLETVGGLEYESCCWGARIVGRNYLRTAEGDFDTAIFLQFEFKGLGGIGETTSSLLRKNIPGYENIF